MNATSKNHYTIHVFRHVHKFMIKNYEHQRGIFKTEEYHTLGKIVSLALFDTRSWKNTNNDQYRDRQTVAINLHLTAQQCRLAPKQFKLQRINLDVDAIFKEHLLTWIRGQQSLGYSVRNSCLSFLEYYNIDSTEYSLENCYKHWQRDKGKGN